MLVEPRPPVLTPVQMSILRDISRAKTLLKAVGNITQRSVPPGSVVVKQGEIGDSMYTVVKVRRLRNLCFAFSVCSASPNMQFQARADQVSFASICSVFACLRRRCAALGGTDSPLVA